MSFFYKRLSLVLKYYIVKLIEKMFSKKISRKLDQYITRYATVLLTFLLIIIFLYLSINNYIFIKDIVLKNKEYRQIMSGLLILFTILLLYIIFSITLISKKEKIQEDYYFNIFPNKQRFSQVWIKWYEYWAIFFYITFLLPIVIATIPLNGSIEIYKGILYILFYKFFMGSHLKIIVYYSELSSIKRLLNVRLKLYGLVTVISIISLLFFVPFYEYYSATKYILLLTLVIMIQLIKFIDINKITKNKNILAYKPHINNNYNLVNTDDSIAVHVNHLNFSYDDKKVLEDINFKLSPGKIYAVLGKNGSGKTTLFKCLNNINNSYHGSIYIQRNILIPAGKEFKFKCTLDNFIDLLSHLGGKINRSNLANIIKKFELEEHRNEYIDDYSLGMKNKVILLGSYLFDIDVYLIDEPFITFDPIALKETLSLLNEMIKENRTIVISTHLLHIAYSISEKILILNDKSISIFENKFIDYHQFEEHVINAIK